MATTNSSDSDVAYVGCYTLPRQADPFVEDSHKGGVPHDESKIGQGMLTLHTSPQGKLSPRLVVDSAIVNPSYVTVLPSRSGDESSVIPSLLCVVSEIEDGKLHTFGIQQDDPTKLTPLQSLSTGGSYPCHVMSHKTRDRTNDEIVDWVFVSNYGSDEQGGSISIYKRTGKGDDVRLSHTISHGTNGSMGAPSRQVSSHAHSCAVSGGSSDVFTADLGLDALLRYSDRDGQWMETGRLALPLGSGPRSMAFNPNPGNKHIAAVSLEMAAQVVLVQVRKHDGCLEVLGSPYSVLPSGWPEEGDPMAEFNNGKWASDSVWSSNGELLFVAARLHNSIAVLRLESSSALTFVGRVQSGGTTPRCLCVHGELLFVVHQHSHDISSFLIDEANGTLTPVDKIETPLPSCVHFLTSR